MFAAASRLPTCALPCCCWISCCWGVLLRKDVRPARIFLCYALSELMLLSWLRCYRRLLLLELLQFGFAAAALSLPFVSSVLH